MDQAKDYFRTAINLWLIPFLIGGSLAIGYEMTHKILIRFENKSKVNHNLLKKEILLTRKNKKYHQIYFYKIMTNNK